MNAKKTNVFPANYRRSEGIYVPKAAVDRFGYSDGDAHEEYLLEVVRKAADSSLFSREIVRSIRDWTSSYHLSPRRANLLRPFIEILQSRVLEVGAGCGAVTRFLGEVGGEVVAVEGSYRRALIARERTRDLDNVEVVSDRIQDFGSRELFDVVVVIGVLEYSRVYMKGSTEPEAEFLAHLGGLLKPNGVVILAIENKLGLKYLAGAPEDHFGAPFAGINDNYTTDSIVTFGQMELRELLNKTSFKEQRWYVPCPDYKLPTTILSPKIISGHHELAATLLAQSAILDPQRPPDPSFSLEQAWSVIEKNGLIEQLANSFLVVAGRSPTALIKIDKDSSIAWHYSTDRHPAFVKQAQFVRRKNSIVVRRSRLQAEPAPAVPLECIIESEHYVDGTNWWRALSSIVNKPNWTVRQVADWARVWIDALLKECKLDAFNGEMFRTYVSGRYFDAAPFNLICPADGAPRFIDQEWRLRPDVELGFLVFRGLRDSLFRVTSSAAQAADTSANINLLISAVLSELGVMVTKIELDRFTLLELQVQGWVQGHAAEDVSDDWVANMRSVAMNRRAPLDRASLIQERAVAVAEGEKKVTEIAEQLTATRNASDQQERERDQLVAALEEEKAAAAANHAQAGLLGQELETLRNAVRDHEAAATKLRVDLDSVQSVSNDRKSEIDRLSGALRSEQSAIRDRDREIERLSRDIDATRLFLRESQAEIQRLAGERDNAWGEAERAVAEHRRVSEEHRIAAAQSTTARDEIAALSGALESARQEADWRGERINDLARELRVAAAQAVRIRDLEARLEGASGEKDRLAAELAKAAAEIRQVEKTAADRVAALEAFRAATLAESENRAQAQLRTLRDQLVDAEAALAKARRGRNGASWAGPYSESRRAARALAKSGLVDAAWYLREYPDVAASGRAPAEHYVAEGYARGYRPNPFFDTRWYLERYEDVRRSGKNPLLHYIQYGFREGRDPGPNFQTRFYLETNPDVRDNGMNPLAHYLRYGRHEGRLPVPRA
jgi:2-polyprenyl-3-methyl-5-hydroxy-6-metoxy-1,4-benzoquinol methylase